MGQRPLVTLAPHRHGNRATDTWLDVYDEALFLITNKNGQGMLICRKYAKNLNRHDIRVHILDLAPVVRNDNGVTEKGTFLSAKCSSDSLDLTKTANQVRCRKR